MPNSDGSKVRTNQDSNDNVLFLLPSIPGSATGPASTWIPAAGWAQALTEAGRQAWVVTPLGTLDAEQTFMIATSKRKASLLSFQTRGIFPKLLGTIKKDVRDAFRGFLFRNAGLAGPWENCSFRFIWQRHELFQFCGARAAKHFGVPLVLFVDAPVIWESEKWGVNRPGWGRLIERFVERRALLRADLVCCISEAVADKVRQLGVSSNRILVTPNATDLSRFRPDLDGQSVRERYALTDHFVIGWVGSFRKFHGLEIILEAGRELQAKLSNVAFMMIGNGLEKERIRQMAGEFGLNKVVFTDIIEYKKLPEFINAMDVAVLSDTGNVGYHYSPLKLQEYLACGRAVVAPRVGQIAQHLHEGIDSLLVEPGNPGALSSAIALLYKDVDLRHRLGLNARLAAIENGGWQKVVNDVEARLGLKRLV